MTQYLYDGVNPVQEIFGTSAPANLLTGGVDEYFQRTDSVGARNFLTDALGSTLALTDSTGAVQTSYTLEPFGNTTITGSATTNSFAFTGRELDPTGLYFFRARYYSTATQRFLTEDPARFAGGANLYAYAANSPVNLVDPSGLKWESFWNNPILDFMGAHSNWLPGACQGGAFYWAGVQGAGKRGVAGYYLGDFNYSPDRGWKNGGGFLGEAFATGTKDSQFGLGVVPSSGEVLAFVLPYEAKGPGGWKAGTGPVYAANFKNYDGIDIGWIVDLETPNPTSGGGQGNAGAGVYLTFTNASTCVEKMMQQTMHGRKSTAKP